MTLKLAIEDAIHKAAPDVVGIEAENTPTAPAPALIALGPPAPPTNGRPANGEWATVGQLRDLEAGGKLLKTVAGMRVLFLSLLDNIYAYQPECPACGRSLEDGVLRAAELQCPGCRHSYDAIRAGRCLDDHDLHLEPVPLLVEDSGLVKVALAPAAA